MNWRLDSGISFNHVISQVGIILLCERKLLRHLSVILHAFIFLSLAPFQESDKCQDLVVTPLTEVQKGVLPSADISNRTYRCLHIIFPDAWPILAVT